MRKISAAFFATLAIVSGHVSATEYSIFGLPGIDQEILGQCCAAINNNGVVAGSASQATPFVAYYAATAANGVVQPLAGLGPSPAFPSFAYAINNPGQVTGKVLVDMGNETFSY